MNKRLFALLQAKCKDFGLTEKAIEDLATIGSDDLTDESSEEDIEKIADSLVPYAKYIQAEITRKAQKKVVEKKQPLAAITEPTTDSNDEPEWFKAYRVEQEKKLNDLREENAQMKNEKAKSERGATITATAKKLGIPDFLMKRIVIDDDADIEKELTEYKQELVTNNLIPASVADIRSSSEKAVQDDAKIWANSLPNIN